MADSSQALYLGRSALTFRIPVSGILSVIAIFRHLTNLHVEPKVVSAGEITLD